MTYQPITTETVFGDPIDSPYVDGYWCAYAELPPVPPDGSTPQQAEDFSRGWSQHQEEIAAEEREAERIER